MVLWLTTGYIIAYEWTYLWFAEKLLATFFAGKPLHYNTVLEGIV